MAHRAVVLTNGEIVDIATLKARLEALPQPVSVIAADGGSRHAAALGLAVDVLIGDFDSIPSQERDRLQSEAVLVKQHPPKKDETDLELALLHAAQSGAERVIIIGALGGRLDMTLANILLLTHPAFSGLRLEIWSGSQTAWLVYPPGDDITGQPRDTLSLIPLGGAAERVTTQGLAYPLCAETLHFGPARGVSNVFETTAVRVELTQGLLLAVHTPGRA